MKVFILVLLSIAFVIQNVSAGWKDNVEINHWNHINSIINNHYGDIKKEAANKGTASAQECSENARRKWADLTSSGFSKVSSCVRSANDEGTANVCCQQVDHDVFEESLVIFKEAKQCISNA